MTSNIVLSGLARDPRSRSEAGRSVCIDLIGSGEMGDAIVTRAGVMDGADIAAISEINHAAAHRSVEIAFREGGHSVDVATADALNDAIERGKHLVMMNIDAEVTIGCYPRRAADRLGVVHSLGAGDEPSSCMELIEFVSAMRHKIICAGRGKNNPLAVDETSDAYEAGAKARHMNPRLLVEFDDDSKTIVEISAIANATGPVPNVDGMHGPAAGPGKLAKVPFPQRDGGILSDIGRVDYSVGEDVSPGVFVIVEAEHPRVQNRMKDLKMGDGPYLEFICPYDLTSLEVPLTCARAVLYGKADMVTMERPVVEVRALTKKDLAPGEMLDQISEFSYSAWAMEASRARSAKTIPAGLPNRRRAGREGRTHHHR